MCGIAGLFNYRGEPARALEGQLIAARDRMAARGPDGAGLWWNGDDRVGLAHRRLAIIDLDDRALQPMHLPERGLSIVFNGEIYNYRELRAELERVHGTQFRTESDTEVLLALFAIEGAEMVHKLRGMFTIAIWDQRGERLFLARDPYGIKPLYYAVAGTSFRFASQVKALLMFADISREPDPAGMVGFQLWGTVPEPFTLYKAISALPAGCRMFVDRDGAGQPESYAHVATALAGARPDRDGPVGEIIAAAALDSVRSHLVADVEVGVFLSSGIDSGSLVGLMRDAGQSRIKAITLGFEELAGSPEDEVPLAREVARHYGAEHHVGIVTRDEFAASADSILDAMDQPSIDGVNTWFVSKATRDCGLKVVLSGLGGDELLGGYPSFRTIPKVRRYASLPARLPFAAQLGKAILRRLAPGFVRKNPKALGLLDYGGTWAGSYLLTRALLLPFELERQMNREVAREGLERLAPFALIERAMTPDPGSNIGRVSALESSLYMRNQLLRDSDWASMAHSLELRVPFVDWPTLQRVAPVSAQLTNGLGKRALANAPSKPLPEACVTRARSGFNIPVANWIGATTARKDRLASRYWSENVLRSFSPA